MTAPPRATAGRAPSARSAGLAGRAGLAPGAAFFAALVTPALVAPALVASALVASALVAPALGHASEPTVVRVEVEERVPTVRARDDRFEAPPRARLPVRARPAPHVRVVALDAHASPLATAVTDASGLAAFASGDLDGAASLLVVAAPVDAAPYSVDDCVRPPCEHPAVWAWNAPVGPTVTVPSRSPAAAALSIRGVFIDAAAFVEHHTGLPPFPLAAHWLPGDATRCGTSCFDGQGGRAHIYLLGLATDSDEYDRSVILHEYAHALDDHHDVTDSPGGWHDGTPIEPSLAFSEGIASAFALLVDDTARYIDTFQEGAAWMDYDLRANDARDVDLAARSPVSEDLVAELVYALAPRLEVSQVLTAWLQRAAAHARGGRAPGSTQLLHLLDAAACASETAARSVSEAAAHHGLAWQPPNRCIDVPAVPATTAPAPARSPITPWRLHVARKRDRVAVQLELRSPFARLDVGVHCGVDGDGARRTVAEIAPGIEDAVHRFSAGVDCAEPVVHVRGVLHNGSVLHIAMSPSSAAHDVPWRHARVVRWGDGWIRVDGAVPWAFAPASGE